MQTIPLRLTRSQNQCVLCRFFYQSRISNGHPTYPHYELCIFRAKTEFGVERLAGIADSIALVVRANYYFDKPAEERIILEDRSQEPNAFSARRLASQVDTALVLEWLSFCDKHHSGCKQPDPPTPRGFRVLDCAARTVVDWENLTSSERRYVALSYVWGGDPAQSLASYGTVPNQLPRTIEDAVFLTQRLGCRYLWVDRYCIPQDDVEAKHLQLQGMDVIYQHAFLTIIAAAGEDPRHGLPGVRDTPRNAQPQCTVGCRTLVSVPFVRHEILESTWNTRGWTYQEGLLSRRKLVFTDTQIYYQCNAMHCLEGIRAPLEALHIHDKTRMRDPVNMSRVFPLRTVGKQWHMLENRISEYLKRSLTFDSDILDAFRGILAAHERRFSASTRILAGIPIPETLPPGTATARALQGLDALAEGMSWFFDDENERRCIILKLERRTGFPSWTWLGWKPHEGVPITLGHYKASVFDDASVEYADGSLLSWDANRKLIFDRGWAGSIPRFLRITGPTLNVRICMDGQLTDEDGLMSLRKNEPDPQRGSWCDIANWTWRQYSPPEPFSLPFTLLILGYGHENHVDFLALYRPPGCEHFHRVDIVSYVWQDFDRAYPLTFWGAVDGWLKREVIVG